MSEEGEGDEEEEEEDEEGGDDVSSWHERLFCLP